MKKFFFLFNWTVMVGMIWGSQVAHASDKTPLPQQVAERTASALKLEATGDAAESRRQLQQIVKEFPDAELARWSLGELSDGKNWWPFDRFTEETGRWPELYKYQQERATRGETFQDQLFLADGCRAHHLRDEERAHLQRALLQDGSFQEAHLRLGHHQIDGVWVTTNQIQREIKRQSRNLTNKKAWQSQAVRLAQELARVSGPGGIKLVQKHLNEIRTPDAIPALEAYFANRNAVAAAMYLNWAAQIPSYEASLALARQSVFAESPQLRVQAQTLLYDRPDEDYVPWLLSGLETVKETAFEWEINLDGLVGLRVNRTVVIDNEQAELTVDHRQRFVDGRGLPLAVKYNPDGSVDARVKRTFGVRSGQFEDPLNTSSLMRQLNLLEQSRTSTLWQSHAQEVRVERILHALAEGTGVESNQTPDDWWAWWHQQNDFVLTKKKAKDQYSETWFVDKRLPQPKPLRSFQTQVALLHSCFIAGTLVETEQGPKAIETIQVGDRVLSQDTETGELAFKPVFDTTVRPHADLLKMQLGSDEITCSQGHPFWVSGMGWRMVKDLHEGARLHHVSGICEVESIEPAGTGTVYNLVVADTHTYFAGSSRLYTHDVTPRAPTDMVLPGLRKEF